MAESDGSVIIKLQLEQDEFNKRLSNLEGQTSNFGSKIKNAILAAGIGTAITKSISDALNSGAALQQSIGGVETLFKENADTVVKYANEAYKTAGISANSYMEQVTSFSASLLSSLGGDTAKAAEAANQAIIDMADNSNKMGTSLESIQSAYQGFAKQNYTMLDNLKLGYGGTKTEMERLLADAQKITGVKYDINNLSDVYSAIHVIQNELDITGTTAKEASTTFSGSLSALQASFENLKGHIALGEDISEDLKSLQETLNTFVTNNLIPMLGNILAQLPGLFIGIIEAMPDLAMSIIEALKTALETSASELLSVDTSVVSNFINGILTQLPQLVTAGGEIINNILNAILTHLPEVLSMGVQLLVNLINGIWTYMPQVLIAMYGVLGNILQTIASHLPQILQAGIELLGQLAAGIIRAIPKLVSQLPQIFNAIKKAFKSVNWLDLGVNIIKGIINGFKSMVGSLGSALSDTVGSAVGSLKSFLGIHSPSRLMKNEIGKYMPPGVAEGFEDAMPEATKRMNTNLNDMVDSFQSNINSDFDFNHSTGDYDSSYPQGNSIDYDRMGEVFDNAMTKLGLKFDKREVARMVKEVL